MVPPYWLLAVLWLGGAQANNGAVRIVRFQKKPNMIYRAVSTLSNMLIYWPFN
jgi:hypothetical protein